MNNFPDAAYILNSTDFLRDFPPGKTWVVQMHRTISHQENITYSIPRPAVSGECTDRRPTLSSQRKFLRWIGYQIFLAMGLRSSAWCARGAPLSSS